MKRLLDRLKESREAIAVVISIVSFLISVIGFYVNSLKPAEIRLITGPYIRHVVDDVSLNEAFFVPLTVVNTGARSGTVMAITLIVQHDESNEMRTYYGQYFAAESGNAELGGFFTPVSIEGNSSKSFTVAFYPLGEENGNLFDTLGFYQFEVNATVTSMSGRGSKPVYELIQVYLDEGMLEVIRSQPDGEYVYPLYASQLTN